MKNPFVGLRPFKREDSFYFFGREEQTRELLSYLQKNRFVSVVGSSGSGKSSLVRAGLFPCLEGGLVEQGSWNITLMNPGESPIFNLASSLLTSFDGNSIPYQADGPTAGDIPGDQEKHMSAVQFEEIIFNQGITGIVHYLTPKYRKAPFHLLIVVDQFEELFRFIKSKEDRLYEAHEFVSLLLGLSRQTDIPVYICLTMRSDYIGDCDIFNGLPEMLNTCQYLVPRLTRVQRRQSITGPLRLAGVSIDPLLLDQLLNESGKDRDSLPVLQHVLLRTFQEWKKTKTGPITIEHYKKAGTLKQALSLDADDAYNSIDSERKKWIARKLFQALTEIDQNKRKIRRSASLQKLMNIIQVREHELLDIIDIFHRNDRTFLNVFPGKTKDERYVSISHESLIRQWKPLDSWVEQESTWAHMYSNLAEDAERHLRDKDYYYTGNKLSEYTTWEKECVPTPEWADQYHEGFDRALKFLKKSRKASHKAELRAKRNRRILVGISLISVFSFIVAALFAFFAWQQQQEAKTQETEAHSLLARVFVERAEHTFEMANSSNKMNNYTDAWLYSWAALRQTRDENRLVLDPVFCGKLFLSPELGFTNSWFSPYRPVENTTVYSVAFSPDGKHLASGLLNSTIRIWDLETGKIESKLMSHDGSVRSMAFSPNGRFLVSGYFDKKIRIWDLKKKEDYKILMGHGNSIRGIAISPDGKLIASGSADTTIRIWDMATGKKIRVLGNHTDKVRCVAFSPDGALLASGSDDRTVRIWKMNIGKEIFVFKEFESPVLCIDFRPGSLYCAAGCQDGSIRIWNLEGTEKISISGHEDAVNGLSFSPDGKQLVSCSSDHTIRLWNSMTGNEEKVFRGHTNAIYSVAFSPNGKKIASGSADNTERIWNLGSGTRESMFLGHTDKIKNIAFSPDGKMFASGSADNTIRIWNCSNGKQEFVLYGHKDLVLNFAFSRDSRKLASSSKDNTVRIWSMETGKEERVISTPDAMVLTVHFLSDTTKLAAGSMNGTIRIWDLETGKEVRVLEEFTGVVQSLTFSPDMTYCAASSSDNTIRIWNLNSETEEQVLQGHSKFVSSLDFSPDERYLVSGSNDTLIILWEVKTGERLRTFKEHGSEVNSLDFSPSGDRIVSGTTDNTIRIWNLKSGKEEMQFRDPDSSIQSVSFSPEGHCIASGSLNGIIRIWNIEPSVSPRNFRGHSQSVISLAFSPDSKFLVSGSTDNTTRTWDVSEQRQKIKYQGHPATVMDVCFLPGETSIVSVSSDGTDVHTWDRESGAEISSFTMNTDTAASITLSSRGNKIATGGFDGVIHVWSTTGDRDEMTLSGHTNTIRCLAFSPDNRRLASGSDDKTIRIWDLATGKNEMSFLIPKDTARCLAFSPDGTSLAAGATDKCIHLWDLETEKEIMTLKGHTSMVLQVAFSPGGEYLASGSSDSTIRLWDVDTGMVDIIIEGHNRSVTKVIFSPDGDFLASGSSDGIISLWNLKTYRSFIKNQKTTLLFYKFMEGALFFVGQSQEGLDFTPSRLPTLYDYDRYGFVFDPVYRPLLDPPAPGQSKFDQIFTWAKVQVEKRERKLF